MYPTTFTYNDTDKKNKYRCSSGYTNKIIVSSTWCLFRHFCVTIVHRALMTTKLPYTQNPQSHTNPVSFLWLSCLGLTHSLVRICG